MLFLLKEIYKRDLNTYHVKVQFVKNVGAYITKTNLNTYHVKVQYAAGVDLFISLHNLNTYHVKVQFGNLQHMLLKY